MNFLEMELTMKKSLKWIVMLSFVFFSVLAVILFNFVLNKIIIPNQFANMPEPSYPVSEYKVTYSKWTPSIKSIGFIQPNQTINVSNEMAGKITLINFVSGEKVTKGDVLLKLDSKTEQATLDGYEATLLQEKSNYERYLKLLQSHSISQSSFDLQKSNYFLAIANVNSAKATLNKLTIKAPFSGTLGLKNVSLGQYIASGTDIVQLDDLHKMELRLTIPQTQLKDIVVGQKVKVSVDAYPNSLFEGQVEALSPGVDNTSGLVEVQVSIPNENDKLRGGMFATANILLPEIPKAMMIPQQAVSYNLYGNYVYVIHKDKEGDERVKQEFITILSQDGNNVVVSSGIKTGDVIVTSGLVSLSNGSKVHKAKKEYTVSPSKSLPKL